MVKRIRARLRWRLKQRLAGDARYYGDGGTIHGSGHLDVETNVDGEVVAVWFRCQPLPFDQHWCDQRRADEMRHLSLNLNLELTRVEVRNEMATAA